ncbi:MAG: hypothetical protein EP344_09190 [Bacteroidetes bacterium]|nr:MAG: hypothetical protein EP344_09190 [Bacteroidota bacterium]
MILIRTSPAFQAEKTYCCQVLMGVLLDTPYTLQFEAGLRNYHITLPDGHKLVVEDHFFETCTAENFLHPEHIPTRTFSLRHPYEPGSELTGIYGRPEYRQEAGTVHCGLDLFAGTFFMLTRWEEHVLQDRDQYGRFPARKTLAFRCGFLDRPVVNEYAGLLRHILLQHGWTPKDYPPAFRLHLSHDVDHPFLWWNRQDKWRTIAASLIKRHNAKEAAWWWRYAGTTDTDPYDCFDEWMDLYEAHGWKASFNFMGERPQTFDCYYPLWHPAVVGLIQRLAARGHTIGFHPSRAAATDPERFSQELESIREVAPVPVRTGRQHYLCFSAPATWQQWADHDMEWDSTLGYPEMPGFRCGICHTFPVFNFLTRKTLPLLEKPLLAMDVTFAHYLKYEPSVALQQLIQLRRQVEKHQGEFVLLWHNSSWNTYFWASWQQMFLDFVESS